MIFRIVAFVFFLLVVGLLVFLLLNYLLRKDIRQLKKEQIEEAIANRQLSRELRNAIKSELEKGKIKDVGDVNKFVEKWGTQKKVL